MSNSENRIARKYARHLLQGLGLSEIELTECGAAGNVESHPARRWAESGLMQLTGQADGPGSMCPLPLAAQADGVISALQALRGNTAAITGAELLSERAQIAGHRRAGSHSPGGSCRLLATADGMIALNLARADDWELLPAWLETAAVEDWQSVACALTTLPMESLVERGRLMGLPVCAMQAPRAEPVPWFVVESTGIPVSYNAGRSPRVVDLSSLWAGPLCARLLQSQGAQVIKVESRQRPDGARLGPPEFFRRMHEDKQQISLDMQSAEGLAELRALIKGADIVIEASRPRALRQLGIDAQALVQGQPGLTWVSITGYGRQSPQADWVGFGDDVGVAAGLSWIMRVATGEPLFCGDAIADPLTGMHAALAAWASYINGGGQLISLPMRDVVTHCIQFDLPKSDDAIRHRQQAWSALANQP